MTGQHANSVSATTVFWVRFTSLLQERFLQRIKRLLQVWFGGNLLPATPEISCRHRVGGGGVSSGYTGLAHVPRIPSFIQLKHREVNAYACHRAYSTGVETEECTLRRRIGHQQLAPWDAHDDVLSLCIG